MSGVHPMRSFNKHVLNRVTRKFAESSRGSFAVIRHVGRRSGKPYETTIMVWPMGDGFVIALTYGPEVDWYRNVQAAGHCTILWHGKEYAIEKVEAIDIKTGLLAFPARFQFILRMLGTRHFIKMLYQTTGPMSVA